MNAHAASLDLLKEYIRLIAAAPNMLEALEYSASYLETNSRHVPADENTQAKVIMDHAVFKDAIDRMEKAIAAAKGE